MKIRILISQFLSLYLSPDHESVHRPAYSGLLRNFLALSTDFRCEIRPRLRKHLHLFRGITRAHIVAGVSSSPTIVSPVIRVDALRYVAPHVLIGFGKDLWEYLGGGNYVLFRVVVAWSHVQRVLLREQGGRRARWGEAVRIGVGGGGRWRCIFHHSGKETNMVSTLVLMVLWKRLSNA